jgi:molybdopterin molybdotransferase
MEFFNVLSVSEVNDFINQKAKVFHIGNENIDLLSALSRIAAEDIYSPINLPAFNRSTVDGYAVISQDVMGASEGMPSYLQCIDEVLMGEKTDLVLKRGQAVYVPTGGMVPDGADGVVMIEYVEKLDEQTLLIYKPIAPGENITYIGDDLKEGECIIKQGKKISPYDIGLFAGIGMKSVKVAKKIKIAIISTGDEIVDIAQPQKMGQIRDINGYALYGRILELGGEVSVKTIVKDDFKKLRESVESALVISDIVLLSGGSSVGTRDFTKAVIESFDGGQVVVHGISIKPGKPTIIGMVKDKMVFGLPGHPASALIIFNRFVKPYMEQAIRKYVPKFSVFATLSANVHASPGKDTYQMVQLVRKKNEYVAEPIHAKSGMMTLLSKASGYIHISNEKEGLLMGQRVEVFLLQEVEL